MILTETEMIMYILFCTDSQNLLITPITTFAIFPCISNSLIIIHWSMTYSAGRLERMCVEPTASFVLQNTVEVICFYYVCQVDPFYITLTSTKLQ